ncbi:1-phosphofructokinase [Leptolyngbya sp. PCC 6406]|uniref:1-phosphofructokinase n=1 Tax=Leptolyngbya sp. PCC 6406 TaxID=1173264 RepID=UPI0002AC465B|nr:1-phosphofructokinase [Leptolyngbya sp. PCC 6406]
MAKGQSQTIAMTVPQSQILTVTLNSAIDHTAAIPNFEANAVNRVTWDQADPGGKGVNVASFLADLGHNTAVTGFLGQDNAARFQALFQQKSIADQFLYIPGATRVNIKVVDEAQQQVTDINFPGVTPSPEAVAQLHQTVADLLPDCAWVVLAGSLPQGVSPGIYRDLTLAAKQAGCRVALDSSGEAMALALSALPDLIKPNRVELEQLLGSPLATETAVVQAARQLGNQGIETVVVSLGAEGALFVQGDCVLHAQPPAIAVKSTVGAGDAMVAGTIAAQLQGKSLENTARLGTGCALGALSQIGPRLPPLAVIRDYGEGVTLRVGGDGVGG